MNNNAEPTYEEDIEVLSRETIEEDLDRIDDDILFTDMMNIGVRGIMNMERRVTCQMMKTI